MTSTTSPATRFLFTFFAGLFACSLQAQTLTWGAGGAGGVGTWNTTTANWWDGANNVTWNNDAAFFAATGSTVTISGGVSATGLTFNATGPYVVTASTLTLTGTAPAVISTVSDAAINSIIAGSTGLIKQGGATLTFGGANTFSGGTQISSGTLQVGNGGTGGILPGDVVNNAALAFNRSNTQTYAGNISGAGSVTKLGTGTQILTGTNTYAGNTTVNNGVLIFGTAASLPATTNIALTSVSGTVGGTVGFGAAPLDQTLLNRVSAGSQGTVALTMDSSNPLDFSARPSISLGASGTATYSGALTPAAGSYRLGGGGGTLTVASTLSGASNVIINGAGSAGTVILSAANTHSGGTVINSGVLSVGNAAAVGSGTLTFGATGAGLSASGGAQAIPNPIMLPAGGDNVSVFRGSNPLTLNGLVTSNIVGDSLRYVVNVNTAPTVFGGGISMDFSTGTATSGVNRSIGMSGLGNITVNRFESPWGASGTLSPNALNINSTIIGTMTVTGTTDFGTNNGNSQLRAFSQSTVLIQGTKTDAKRVNFQFVTGGKILLDLAEGDNRWGNDTVATDVNSRGGTLEILGTASGTRSQSFGGLGIGLRGSGTILVNPNGGPGTTIFLGGTGWGGVSGTTNSVIPTGSVLLDVSAPNAFAKVRAGSAANLLNMAPGGQDPTSGVAQFILIKDSTGIGYVTHGQTGAGLTPDIARYTGATPLTATSSGTLTNFKIESSSVTLDPFVTPDDGFSTLSIDTSAGGGTLDLGGNSVYTNGILVTGNNDYTISNGTLVGGSVSGAITTRTAVFYHYGTGLLNFAGTVNSFANFTKTGPGTMVVTGSNELINTNVVISGGALRTALTGQLLAGTEILQLTGGVLESNGIFTRTTGTLAGQVNFGGTEGIAVGGGFAAHGGNLIINLNSGTAAITLWSSAAAGPLYNGTALMLNSKTADSMVDFQNAIAMGSSSQAARVIDVEDNPNLTTDFARISGVISGPVSAIGGTPLVKAGPGLLQFTATNTYVGQTIVLDGTLVVTSSGAINAASQISVKPGAAFGGSGSVGQVIVESLGELLLQSDIVDANGLSATSVTLGEDSTIEVTLGTLNGMLTTPNFLAESGLTNINLDLNYSGNGLTIGQTLTLVDYTATNFNTSDVSQFTINNVGPGLLEGTVFWDTGDTSLKFTITNAIPEPATWLLLGLGSFLAAGLKLRRFRS